MPPVTGLCLGYFPAWNYNSRLGECEEFVYGGCGGNANRFQTEEACLSTCATGDGK